MYASIKKVVDNTHPWNAGEMWNDAYIHGEASAEFDALMSCTAPLIEKDWGKRFMPTRGWNAKAKTWGEWLADSLTWHREDDRKDGAGYVFGASANGERKAENMRGMVAIGLDIEPEQPLDDVINRCEASGLAIVLYTSHNHERTTDCEPVDTILKHGDEVSTETVRTYLRHKGGYSEDFISQCELTDPRADIDGKIQALWSCPPLQKMRAVALFEEPVDITTLDPSPKRGQEIWANKVRGLAQMLGVRIDPVATDPSRILYIAKHRPSADYYCAVFRGRPVRWDEIPEVAKSAENPFLQAGGKGGSTVPDVATSTGIDVTALYRRYGKRWILADMLSDSHVAKSEGSDRLHVECPFSDEHTSESGPTSTTVWNAGETEHGFAKVLCQHSCKEKYPHTVHYVARWIEAGVIDPDWLEDPSFMIGAPDQPGPFEELTPAELEEERAEAAEQAQDFEARAAEFTMDANESDLVSFLAEAHAAEITDKGIRERINATLAKQTALKLDDVRSIWAKLDRKAQAEERKKIAEARRNSEPAPFVPLEEATTATVERAAQNAAWLPPFVSYESGWFRAVDFDKPDAGPKRICRAFEVPHVAFGETEEGRTNEITIRYRHRSAQRGIVESTYRIGDTYRDTGSFVSRLVDEGFETDPQAKTEMLVMLLRAVNTDNEAVLVEKAGWHGDTYVSPTGTVIGGNVRYILNPKGRVSGRTAGTLADHHRYATTALTGANGRLLLPGYLSGLVGCLVDFIENDVSPVLTMEGDSTTGKTTAGKMGAAHFAPPDNTGLFMKADQTATATENNAERANGSVLVLDEEGASKLDAGEKQRLILQWADGAGRGRGTRDAGVQRTRTWRTCFVTSAERGFLNRLTAEGADPLTGAVARVFSVNFDGANTLEDGSDDLAAIRALSGDDRDAAIYGVTGPVFAEKLAELGRDAVRSRVSGVADEWADLGPGAARRVVRLAALFCVAGEIAQEAGLFGSEVPVKEHMQALLEATLDARMPHLDTDRQQLEALRRAIRRGVQTGDIVSMHDPEDYNRKERLGYYGHLTENGRPNDSAAKKMQDPETAMRARTYILPEDRLSKLGITTGHKALADRLRDVGALVERRKGERMQAFHDYIPGEGKGRNIRVTGEFVHGKED